MKSEFEEKSYEAAFMQELIGGQSHPTLFSPGQVAEGLFGFDAMAALASQHPFWASVAQSAGGGYQIPNNSKFVLPKQLFNLFLQFKRSDYMHGRNARHRSHFGNPYYRFSFDDPSKQLSALQLLQGLAGSKAHVYYSAPHFHTVDDLVQHHLNDSIITNSRLVSPGALSANHKTFNFLDGYTSVQNPHAEETAHFSAKEVLSDANVRNGSIASSEIAFEGFADKLLATSDNEVWSRLVETIAGESSEVADQSDFLMLAAFVSVHGIRWQFLGPRVIDVDGPMSDA